MIEADRSLPGLRVARVLDRLQATVGLPHSIVVDNGPEFAGLALDAWAYARGVRTSHSPCSGKGGHRALGRTQRHREQPGEHRDVLERTGHSCAVISSPENKLAARGENQFSHADM